MVQNPPQLLRYQNPLTCNSCSPETVIDSAKFAVFGALTPTGVALTEDSILVSTDEGIIGEFGLNGEFLEDFASVSQRAVKIATGVLNGETTAFVNVHPGTHVAFKVATGVPSNTVDLTNPSSGVTVSGGPAFTPAGNNVAVSLPGVKALFETVSNGGFTSNDCTDFVDLRGPNDNGIVLCTNTTTGCPGLQFGDIVEDLGFPRRIPSNIRPFINSATGQPTFVFCKVSGNITTAGVIEWTNQASVDAGFEDTNGGALTCADKPKILWAADFVSDDDDLLLVEGDDFVDMTIGCVNPRSGGSTRRSGLLPLAFDTRAPKDKLSFQIGNLAEALSKYITAGFITNATVQQDLQDAIAAAQTSKSVRKKLKALNSFRQIADDNEDTAFNDGTTNVSGDLRARPRWAMFTICDNFFKKKKPGECSNIPF